MYRAMEIFNELCERCGATVLPMAALAEDDELFEQARLFQANTLVGMPTRILALARYLEKEKLNWNFDTVVFGGEFFRPAKRQFDTGDDAGSPLLRTVWLSRIGRGRMERRYRRVARLPVPAGYPAHRNCRSRPGGLGPIVATNVVRRRFPIIRYRTGDVGRVIAEGGKTVTVELRGRDADSFQIGDDYHSLGDFAEIFNRFSEFQIQIRFEETLKQDVIRFCLVPGCVSLTGEEKERVRRRIRELLQAHEKMYRVEIEFVSAADLIQKGSARKTPSVIDGRGR